MTNFSAAHESRLPCLGDDRVAFPDNHIEVDNRLSWFLGRLDAAYGDRGYYVHLERDPAQVVASWSRRFFVLGGIAPAYRDHILAGASNNIPISRIDAAADYVRTVTENINLFLKDKSHVMRIRFENVTEQFPQFWEWIGAEGDLAAAVAELSRRHDGEVERVRLKQRIWDLGQRTRRAFWPPA